MRNLTILDKSIEILDLSDQIVKKLETFNIKTIRELWQCKLIFLKENSFTTREINQIRIKLQLKGIDLNKKVY